MIWGTAYEMLRNSTAEVTIELKAVVETRYSRPYKHANMIEATVVRSGKFILSSMWEKYLAKGTPFYSQQLVLGL